MAVRRHLSHMFSLCTLQCDTSVSAAVQMDKLICSQCCDAEPQGQGSCSHTEFSQEPTNAVGNMSALQALKATHRGKGQE